MATPKPRTLLRKMVNQGQRLRIVYQDYVVVDAVPNSVFEIHLLENARLYFGEVNVGTLKSVVHFLRDVEEIRSSLDYTPLSLYSEAIHYQRHSRAQFG